MRRLFLSSFSFFIFFISCSKVSETNDYIIPEDVFIKMMTEVYLSDGMLKSNAFPSDVLQNDSLIFDKIQKDYGYSKQQYDSTAHYYSTSNIKRLDYIYESVLKELQKIEMSLEKE